MKFKIFIVFKFKYQLAILFFLLYTVNNYMPTIHVKVEGVWFYFKS